MTSTSSANATSLPSRRSLITQASMLASVTAAGATMALPVSADEPGPIERMFPEHARLAEAYAAASDAEWEAEKRYVEPERPRWHPFTAEGGYKLQPLPENKCRCFLDDGDENIAYLKDLISKKFESDAEDQGYRNADLAKCARKTLAEIEAWKAEAQRRKDEVGLTAASMASAEAEEAVEAHAAKIYAIEPTSIRELAFRAAVLLNTWNDEAVEWLPEQLVELAGIDPHPNDGRA